MTTNVPAIQFTPTGLVIPAEPAILGGVQADYNAAAGGNLNPALNTPQGQLASSTSAIIADANSTIAEFVDQVDPDNATGFMQDAIGRIYFLDRIPGAPTVVQLLCTGANGADIVVGAQARDTSGNIYVCVQAGIIPASGNILLNFQNQQVGPIPCPANTVTQIYQMIPGWDTVNNPSPGTVGQFVENTANFEFRRQNSVAANAHGSLPSIYGAVVKVPGVLDAYAFENPTDSPIYIGSTNFELLPHSLLVSVTGGAAADVAYAIWSKKDVGCNMNGNTSAVITDNSYSYPQPQYTIAWETPAPTQYPFIVNIVNSTSLPSNIVSLVQSAVTAQFNGTNAAGQKARIGSLLLAAAFYGPVANSTGEMGQVQLLSIYIGSLFTGLGTLASGSDVLTITTASSGTLNPGTIVSGTDIPAATTVVQQLTGTPGGIGTYQMSANASATVSSPESITGSGGTSQLIGVDQQPQIGNIVVNLI